jgi:undecaprenyl-diphosphatase
MTWLEAIFLGALQGVTEFLPISSSGHLVLFQSMFGWDNPDNAQEWFFDGVLHLGTLLAVVLYFGREFAQSLRRVVRHPVVPDGQTMAWPATFEDVLILTCWIGLASLPAALAVLFSSDSIKQSFKQPGVVAFNFLILGAVLIATGWIKPGTTTGPAMRWWQVIMIGVAQGISAVMRGMSRSGTTMAAALLVGLERTWAVRFSFLMSVVASLGLGVSGIWKALKEDPQRAQWLTNEFLVKTIVATLVSAIVGYLTITPLIALVKRARLWIFGLYVWLVALAYYVGTMVQHR